MGMGLMMWIAAFFIHYATNRLVTHGRLVPCTLRPEYAQGGEAAIGQMLGGGPAMAFMGVLNALGKYIPCVMMNYDVMIKGKKKNFAQYYFSDEIPDIDENGQSWVLWDPQNPRFYSYLVSEIPD